MKKILLSLVLLLSSSFAFGAALEENATEGGAGAIAQLVTLLGSEDDETQEYAV